MMNCQTLKFRVIAMSLFVLIMGATFRFGLALPLSKQQIQDLVATQQIAFASYVARDIGQRIDARRALISRLATEVPRTLGNADQFDAWIGQLRNANPQFARRILVIGLDGKVTQDSALEGQHLDVESFADQAWFREALNSTTPVLSKPQRDLVQGAVMFIASPVRDADRNITAVLAGIFSLDSPGLPQGMSNHPVGESGGLLLISGSEEILVGASDPAKALAPTPAPGRKLLHDKAIGGYRGTGITTNIDGADELSSIVSVPKTDWFVVARMPVSEAFQPVYGLIDAAIKGTLLGLAAVFLLVFLLSRAYCAP